MARFRDRLRRWGPRVLLVAALALAITAVATATLTYEPARDSLPLWVWPGIPLLVALIVLVAVRRAQGQHRR